MKDIRPLNQMLFACRPAAAVYLALLDIANLHGKSAFHVSREEIARASTVRRFKTVSRCLKVLDESGWIKLRRRNFSDGKKIVTTLLVVMTKDWKLQKRKFKRIKLR